MPPPNSPAVAIRVQVVANAANLGDSTGVFAGMTIAPLSGMKRYLTIGILVGAALLANVSTASAQRWGREATPRSGVCFYEDINFQGRYFCTPVGYAVEAV